MGITDADPAGQDSPEVQRLKQELADAQSKQAADPGQPEPEPEATSTEVADLRKQLEDRQKEIDRLTEQAFAQKDPETATPGTDVQGLLHEIVKNQGEYRNELAALRTEVSKARRYQTTGIPTTTVAPLSAEELQAQRQEELSAARFYCPACGRTYKYERECTGKPESPHPAVDVVSTDEVKDPPDPKDKEVVEKWQSGHTAMEYVEPGVNERLSLV